jgi:hypothetical protein
LTRLGQIQGHSVNATSNFPLKDLEGGASYLVKAGYAQRQGHGVGFKPDGWVNLRDKGASLAHAAQLGMSFGGGWSGSTQKARLMNPQKSRSRPLNQPF